MNTAFQTIDRRGGPARSTTPPARAGTHARRSLTVVAAMIAMVVGLTTGALAGGAGYEEQPHREGLFYGDFDKDVLLFAGSTAEDFCNDLEPTHDARVFHRDDGSVDIKVDASEQPIYLYSSPLGAPELIEATCEAMFDGDPGTVPLQPIAVGEGLVRMRIEIAADGTEHVVNSTLGSAASAEGTTWNVRGWADLIVVNGAPVGDPADFQGLRVTETGA